MSVITWKNVDAPDFSTALKGVETANTLFNRAIASGAGLVNGVRDMQTDAANRAILGRMNAITDPTAYAQAQQQGLIVGPDAQNASVEMLQKAADRGATLVTNAQSAENLRQDIYTNQRKEQFNAADDAFAPQFGKWQESAKAGRFGDLETLTKTPEFLALDLDTKRQLVSDFQTAATSKQNFDFGKTREAREAARAAREAAAAKRDTDIYNRQKEDQAAQDAALGFIMTHRKAGTPSEYVRVSLENEFAGGKWNPRQQAIIANAVTSQMGVPTKYTENPVESPLDPSATPEQEMAALGAIAEEQNNFTGRVSALDTKMGKFATVGGLDHTTYRANQKDETPWDQALDKALESGPLKGASKEELTALFRKYQKKGLIGTGDKQVSPTNFFAIVGKSLTQDHWYQDTWDIGLPTNVDEDATTGQKGLLTLNLEDATQQDLSLREKEYNKVAAKKGNLVAAEKAQADARAYYQRIKTLAQGDESMAGQLESARKAKEKAEARFKLASAEADK